MPVNPGGAMDGGWWVFGGLVAVWVGLTVEFRTRKLTALLEAALEETAQLRARERAAQAGQEKTCAGAELEQLAKAVGQQGGGPAPAFESIKVDSGAELRGGAFADRTRNP
jgi:hypothetical protein